MRKPFAIATDAGKVVKHSVLDGYAIKADEESRSIPVDSFGQTYTKDQLVTPLYNPEALAQLLELNTWHSRACYTKANDVAGLGWGLMPTKEDESASEAEKAELDDFFVNGIVSANTLDDLLTEAMVDFEAIGILYIEVVRENHEPKGKPVKIKHLPSHTIRVHSSLDKFAQIRGTKKRWFKRYGFEGDVDFDTGEVFPQGSLDASRRATEIISIKNYSSRSDFYGFPQVVPALGALTGMQSLRDYNIAFFDNYGIPSYAIYITGDYDLGVPTDTQGRVEGDQDFDATKADFPIINEIKTHLDTIRQNPSAPLILAIPNTIGGGGEVKIEFKPLSVEVKEASFRLYRKDSRDEIIVAHGIPPYRLGITETGSLGGNIAENADKVYKESVLNPRKRLITSTINKLIINDGFGFTSWQFWLEDLDTADEEHDMKLVEFMFASGAVTPNEIIAIFGERFGIKPKTDIAEMNLHFVNNTQLEAGETGNEAVKELFTSVKGLHSRLVNIAIKDEVKNDS